MKSLIEIFIVVYLFITNALTVENFKKKVTNILEDYENSDRSVDRLSKMDSEFFTLSEKNQRRKKNSFKSKFLSLSPEILPIEKAPQFPEVPLVDENTKLFDNFNQGVNSQIIPDPIYTSNQNYITNNNIDGNFIPLSSYDNSYHRSQYFSNSNDYLTRRKNEDLEKKYASYRKPEYVHTNYKTVSSFPKDDDLNEVFDDPVFLEGKLEDQNKLKVKVPIKVADRFEKLNFPEENRNDTANSQEIVFSSNQINLNSNYKYSKAKIINEKDSSNTGNKGFKNFETGKKKENKKVSEVKHKISNFSDSNRSESNSDPEVTVKPKIQLNETKKENLNELKNFNDKRNYEKGVIYKNITINGENDLKVLEQDMKILKFDFLNVTDYLRNKKLLRLNLNLLFENNSLHINFTNVTQTTAKPSNSTKILREIKKDNSLKNKTHLENKIKEFITEKIINKTLNVSNINNITKKEIKQIVSHFKANEEIVKENKTNSLKNNNQKSLNKSKTVENKGSNKMKKSFKNVNSTELLYKNLDKVSERLTLMFKKVLKDIVLNPSEYILEDKLENNLSFMKREIRNSLSDSIEIPARNRSEVKNITDDVTKSEIGRKVNEIANSTKLNITKQPVAEAIKNSTRDFFKKSKEIKFIETKSGGNLKKNNLKNKPISKNLSNSSKKEIHNLINKKIDNNNKIEFVLKKSYSKRIPIMALQTNHSISAESKTHVNHKATELEHEVKKHIKENLPRIIKPLNNENKNMTNNKTNEKKQILHASTVKNLSENDNKKHENIKIYEKFQSQKNSTSEIEKKIILQLPKIDKLSENKKSNSSIHKDKENSSRTNNSSRFKTNHNSTIQNFKKAQSNHTTTISNKRKLISNQIKDLKIDPKISQNQKGTNETSNLRKEIKLQENENSNYKNNSPNNSVNSQNNKAVSSVFSHDLNDLHTKNVPSKKADLKNEEMEIDDGSVMAEILKAYRKKFKARKD